MFDMNSGYHGYSMSNRARRAYANGEMPISKWSKKIILEAANEIRSDLVDALSNLTVAELREHALYNSSWHHTSSRCNETNFYAINDDFFEEATLETINEIISKRQKKAKPEAVRRKANIKYLIWSGTRNHPKATDEKMCDVEIEIRGSFYVVFDQQGKEVLRKKIGSTGTVVEWKDK